MHGGDKVIVAHPGRTYMGDGSLRSGMWWELVGTKKPGSSMIGGSRGGAVGRSSGSGARHEGNKYPTSRIGAGHGIAIQQVVGLDGAIVFIL
jgi:hypothetical protein